MANTLKIVKTGTNKFWHIHNDMDASKFILSSFSATLDGNKFNIVQVDGAVRFTYLVENITIQDQSTGGVDETFVSPIIFWNRLIALNYTPFFLIPTTGLTTDVLDALNNAYAPNASNPYVTLSQLGGSVSSQITKIFFDESAVTVPAGFTGAVINLTQPNSTVTYTVSGTSMTITGGADDGDVLIF